jgi:hypothetical protein
MRNPSHVEAKLKTSLNQTPCFKNSTLKSNGYLNRQVLGSSSGHDHTNKNEAAIVPCHCKTWSRALREEHRLRVFENRVLRRIFGSKRNVNRRMEEVAQ